MGYATRRHVLGTVQGLSYSPVTAEKATDWKRESGLTPLPPQKEQEQGSTEFNTKQD